MPVTYYNYEMLIAGKIRKFDYIILNPSKFNPNTLTLSSEENIRISSIVFQDLLNSKEDLTKEEYSFILDFHFTQLRHIIQKPLIDIKHFHPSESSKIREFYKEKIVF